MIEYDNLIFAIILQLLIKKKFCLGYPPEYQGDFDEISYHYALEGIRHKLDFIFAHLPHELLLYDSEKEIAVKRGKEDEFKLWAEQYVDEFGYVYKSLKDAFVKKIDETLPLRRYPTKSWEFAPFLLLKYLDAPSFVKSISINNTMFSYFYENYAPFLDDSCCDWQNYFSYSAEVDAASLSKVYKIKDANKSPKKPQKQYLLEELNKFVQEKGNNNIEYISFDEIKEIVDKICKDDEVKKYKDKYYENHVSDLRAYIKKYGYEYTLGRKIFKIYYIVKSSEVSEEKEI